MFSGIWDKLKEIIRKMIGPRTVEQALHINPTISTKMADAIQLWSDMYEGNSPWLREPRPGYPVRITSLGLPQLIASEKARMVTLEMESKITAPMKEEDRINPDFEKPEIGADGSISMGRGRLVNKADIPKGPTERAEFLNTQYTKLKKQIRRQLEYGIAKGGLVIKPYVVKYDSIPTAGNDVTERENATDGLTGEYKTNAEIEFDFIQADGFYPLSFDANGKVIEAAFVQRKVDKDVVYSRLEYHKLERNTVTVINKAYKSKNNSLDTENQLNVDLGDEIPLSQVTEWSTLEPKTVIADVDRLMFAYFRMPDANTIDTYSPLGVSGYSRVINLIKDADYQYSRLLWEFEGGELAIDVDRYAMRTEQDSDGKTHTVMPIAQERLFRKVDLNAEDTYNVFAPELRDKSLLSGLNAILMKIEDCTGLSRGTISETPSYEAKTATELKILKQRSFATNADIQQALEDALKDAIYVMDTYCTLYNVTPKGEYETSFTWDDSIIVDVESELAKRITLMQNGLASKVETRMWYFGETENQAKEALQKVEDETKQAMETNMMAQMELGEAGQSTKSPENEETLAGDHNRVSNKNGEKAKDSIKMDSKGNPVDKEVTK